MHFDQKEVRSQIVNMKVSPNSLMLLWSHSTKGKHVGLFVIRMLFNLEMVKSTTEVRRVKKYLPTLKVAKSSQRPFMSSRDDISDFNTCRPTNATVVQIHAFHWETYFSTKLSFDINQLQTTKTKQQSPIAIYVPRSNCKMFPGFIYFPEEVLENNRGNFNKLRSCSVNRPKLNCFHK